MEDLPVMRYQPNVRLNEERENIPGPPDIKPILNKLLEKTKNLHASWLFGHSGMKTLNELCLQLDATSCRVNMSGWRDFGILLGIDPRLIKAIEYGNRTTPQGPTDYVLWMYGKEKNATIGNILTILDKLNRHDVILELNEHILKLASEASVCNQNNEDSGVISQSESSEASCEITHSLASEEITNIVMPPYVCSNEKDYIGIENYLQKYVDECFQNSNVINKHHIRQERKEVKRKYGCTVMLTFATDGKNYANQIAKILRQEREGLGRIGVLILDEQLNNVNKNPECFISSCLRQVDYVIPVITEGYLKAIASTYQPPESMVMCTDAKYVKFIYTFMNNQLITNGCINYKVRCVIPNDLVHLSRHSLMQTPLLQAWLRLSETEQLGFILLKATMSSSG